MYDYRKATIENVKDAIRENYSAEYIQTLTREEFEEELNDALWIDDSVTGNASGSYTFSRCEAKNNILSDDNTELLREALECFGTDAQTIADKFLSEDWEYFDVTIRCYILGECIGEALEELAENDPQLFAA